jgi:hypothetical protein
MPWRWPWSRKPQPLPIPPFVPLLKRAPPPEPTIIVEEVDTSQMSQTGVHRAWQSLARPGDKKE